MPHRTFNASVWFGDRWDRAKALIDDGYILPAVAEEVGVTLEQLKIKINNTKMFANPPKVSNEALIERERRREASHRRGLTATLCGDPPPGYSELDKRAANKKAAPKLDGHATQQTGRHVSAAARASVPAAQGSAAGLAVVPERASVAGSDFGSGSGRPFESPVVRDGNDAQRADGRKVRA